MDFEQRLAAHAAQVEGELERMLAARTDVPARLAAAMRYAMLGGGKRFRPFLVLETAALFGVDARPVLPAACAVECVHCYSLVHDDLPAMDNDEMRRGRPSLWKAYDEWTAILAGDALLTLAFEILASESSHAEPAIRAGLVLGLAAAAGASGMVGGQCLDLEADKTGLRPVGAADVVRIQSKKTGVLIAFASEAGAMLGRATGSQRRALRSYGERLGLAFQIADDLLDIEGDADMVGKAVAKDAAAGKATLVSVFGMDGARAKRAEVEAEAIAALAPFGERAAVLAEAARFVSRRRR